MSRNVFYKYNPETDNFERVYPTFRSRLVSFGRLLLTSAILASVACFIFYRCSGADNNTLRRENSQLRAQYNVLSRRLDNSLSVMENIRLRDDNFYRVMMQMEPMSNSERFSGLENESRYKKLQKLSDAALVTRLTRDMDLLDRQLYAQSKSFDELRQNAISQKDKLSHIPSIIPIHVENYTMASGYGYRRDPVYGCSKFHAGLDFAAKTGTEVYATADGTVMEAGRRSGYGNCIDIGHGYNYTTRYAHLDKILVKEGQKVRRGELIGKVGSTGKSTGPHLHYEVLFKGEPQNPVNYYFMDLTPPEYAALIREAENAGHVMD